MAQSFMLHKAPVRIGLVFSSYKETKADPSSKVGILRRVLNFAASEGKMRRTFKEIVEVRL